MLHAGGKFGGEGYKISGGLHGVGVSVVNALSSRLELEIDRDGGQLRDGVRRRRRAAGQARARRRRPTAHGTTITFWPDPHVFEEIEFRAQTLLERLREMAFLNKGLEIRFRDERAGRRAEQIVQVRRRHRRLRAAPQRVEGAAVQATWSSYIERPTTSGEVEVALQWNTGYYEGIHSFANNIATTEGGMHEEGFKKALTNVVNRYAKAKSLLKEKDDNLLGEDIREGLTAIVSVKLRNPQFEGQTKTKLGNTEMRSLVEKATNEKLADWLEEHPTEAKHDRRARRSQAAQARDGGAPGPRPHPAQVAARVRRRCRASSPTARRATPTSRELFIVEGDSAGGSAKQRPRPARSRRSCRSAARSSTSSGPASTRC